MDIRELAATLARDYGRDVLEVGNTQILRNALVRRGFPDTLGSLEFLELEIRRCLGLPYTEPED